MSSLKNMMASAINIFLVVMYLSIETDHRLVMAMRVCCWRELILCVLQVRNEFYKDSQGVILVYDVGLRESFDALDSWLTEMKQEMGSQANMENIIFIVCANKVPLVFKYLLWYLWFTVYVRDCYKVWSLTHKGWPDKKASCGWQWGETLGREQRISLLWNFCSEWWRHQWNVSGMYSHTSLFIWLPCCSVFLKNGCSLFIMCPPPQAFFSSITDMCENGGKRPTPEVNVGFTKEQADTIRRIRNSKDSWDMLGVKPGATR